MDALEEVLKYANEYLGIENEFDYFVVTQNYSTILRGNTNMARAGIELVNAKSYMSFNHKLAIAVEAYEGLKIKDGHFIVGDFSEDDVFLNYMKIKDRKIMETKKVGKVNHLRRTTDYIYNLRDVEKRYDDYYIKRENLFPRLVDLSTVNKKEVLSYNDLDDTYQFIGFEAYREYREYNKDGLLFKEYETEESGLIADSIIRSFNATLISHLEDLSIPDQEVKILCGDLSKDSVLFKDLLNTGYKNFMVPDIQSHKAISIGLVSLVDFCLRETYLSIERIPIIKDEDLSIDGKREALIIGNLVQDLKKGRMAAIISDDKSLTDTVDLKNCIFSSTLSRKVRHFMNRIRGAKDFNRVYILVKEEDIDKFFKTKSSIIGKNLYKITKKEYLFEFRSVVSKVAMANDWLNIIPIGRASNPFFYHLLEGTGHPMVCSNISNANEWEVLRASDVNSQINNKRVEDIVYYETLYKRPPSRKSFFGRGHFSKDYDSFNVLKEGRLDEERIIELYKMSMCNIKSLIKYFGYKWVKVSELIENNKTKQWSNINEFERLKHCLKKDEFFNPITGYIIGNKKIAYTGTHRAELYRLMIEEDSIDPNKEVLIITIPEYIKDCRKINKIKSKAYYKEMNKPHNLFYLRDSKGKYDDFDRKITRGIVREVDIIEVSHEVDFFKLSFSISEILRSLLEEYYLENEHYPIEVLNMGKVFTDKNKFKKWMEEEDIWKL